MLSLNLQIISVVVVVFRLEKVGTDVVTKPRESDIQVTVHRDKFL